MTGAALLIALVLTGADDLSATQVGGLTLKVPSAWKATHAEDGTAHFDAPDSDASFEVSVYPVSPRREGKLCVDQLVKALGPEGWERLTLGKAPAARKVATESAAPQEEDGKKAEPVEVQTTTYVGCDGKTKWVLTVSHSTQQKARYEALSRKILASLAYPR